MHSPAKIQVLAQNGDVPLDSMSSESTATNTSVFSFPFAIAATAILLASGFFHLAKLQLEGAAWEGPLSPRKPGLFGISAGVTLWSLTWLITQLRPIRFDRAIVRIIAASLLVEVGLITLQYWRGVPSHFNHATILDAWIETVMLVLILIATLLIFYLTVRTVHLRSVDGSMVVAIRGGMVLLSVSCGLGILTTVLGQMNVASGQRYETWGNSGVLKFPHGVVLHAIQLLPIISWSMRRLGVVHRVPLMWAALASQFLFLIYALRQTFLGLDRFDCDGTGSVMIGVVVLLSLFPIAAISRASVMHALRRRRDV